MNNSEVKKAIIDALNSSDCGITGKTNILHEIERNIREEQAEKEMEEKRYFKMYSPALNAVLCKWDSCKYNINHECFKNDAMYPEFMNIAAVDCVEERES